MSVWHIVKSMAYYATNHRYINSYNNAGQCYCFAQKISLLKTKATLKTVFREIKAQSGYNFLYTDDQLKDSKLVNINVNGAALEEVLREIFKDQPLTYLIDSKTVVIKEKEPTIIDRVKSFFQQDSVIFKGQVLNEYGLPLPGATVKVVGTKCDIATIKPDEKHYFHNVSNEECLIKVTVSPGNRNFENALLISKGLAIDGLASDAGTPKKLSDLAIFVYLNNSRMVGIRKIAEPIFNFITRVAIKDGRLNELILKYCNRDLNKY